MTDAKKRKPWAQYFLDIAEQVAARSTCDRKHVGCVVASADHVILATGFNGSARGLDHCDDVGHDLVETRREDGTHAPNCVRAVHAESNAIAQAARRGVSLNHGVVYVNTFPCWPCFRLLVNAGIALVVYRDEYREDPRVRKASEIARVPVIAERDYEAWRRASPQVTYASR